MKLGPIVLMCHLFIAGCTGSTPPAVVPSEAPRSTEDQMLSPEELEKAVAPQRTLVFNAALDIKPIVEAYLKNSLSESRIESSETRLTTIAEIHTLANSQGGMYTPESAVYLVTVKGDMVWPGSARTEVNLTTGEIIERAVRGDTLYQVFSAQDGREMLMLMPKKAL